MAEEFEMICRDVTESATDYLEQALPPEQHSLLEAHLKECSGCRTYVEQLRQTVRSLGKMDGEPVAPAACENLRSLFRSFCRSEARAGSLPIRLGIDEAYVSAGDHIGYFWENEAQFEEAIGFLGVGLRGRDTCFVFGHDQANQKVLDLLRKRGLDVDAFREKGRLQVLTGDESGEEMLAGVGAAFQAAIAAGAPLLRLLGNIGWRRPGWPGDDDILEFEAKVTAAAQQFPCIVVCMYDVQALPGRIILKGGFETHPLTLRPAGICENPQYQPVEKFLAELKGGSTLDSVQ